MKRVLSILLVTLLAFSAMSIMAVNATGASITVGNASGKAGDVVEVPVTIADCPDIITYNVTVNYSKTDLELTAITKNASAYGTVSTNKDAANISMDADEDGNVNGEIATLKFKILDGAKTTSTVSLTVNIASAFDWDTFEYTDVTVTPVAGTITVAAAEPTAQENFEAAIEAGQALAPADTFGTNCGAPANFKGLEMLGVQQKVDDGSDVRFITAVSKDVLNDAAVTDYGYIFAKSSKAVANDKIANLTVANAKNKFSCKGTDCSVAGDFGDPAKGTDYTYVTCGVNGIAAGNYIVGRFYVETSYGTTYYYATTSDNLNGVVYSIA